MLGLFRSFFPKIDIEIFNLSSNFRLNTSSLKLDNEVLSNAMNESKSFLKIWNKAHDFKIFDVVCSKPFPHCQSCVSFV